MGNKVSLLLVLGWATFFLARVIFGPAVFGSSQARAGLICPRLTNFDLIWPIFDQYFELEIQLF